MTGVSAMVLGLMLAGYAFANGLGAGIVEALAPPMVVVTLQDDVRPPPERHETETLSTTVVAPEPPPPTIPDQNFTAEKKSPIEGDATKPPVDPGAGVTPPPRSVTRALPKLAAKDKPEYPPSAIRGHKEGTTGLDVCVDARGRATSVSLASSSGHEILDQAAIKWVRTTRFAPGTLDGQAAAMCGARVFYEWKITN
ncbi:MAG TPA: energy transducer TonB, partial [Hyphomonadaceae bacterium]|nr:energy transducer TonB [Hyphomonadaceae bacterium]